MIRGVTNLVAPITHMQTQRWFGSNLVRETRVRHSCQGPLLPPLCVAHVHVSTLTHPTSLDCNDLLPELESHSQEKKREKKRIRVAL